MTPLSKEQLEEDLKVIHKNTDKNEKLAWVRKRKRLEEVVQKELQPIEDQIIDLINKKQPVIQEINDLRKVMIKDCVHPEDYLVHHGAHIECKFCDRKIYINRPSLLG
jgi:DNA-binding protein H-NS